MLKSHPRAGVYLPQPTGYKAFIPKALPPYPSLRIDSQLLNLLTDAYGALCKLDAKTDNLPNPDLFVASFVNKEALLSSQIEGTQASLEDVFAFDLNRTSDSFDILEVINYVKALNYGLERLDSFPLSLRLIREIHKRLISGTRGTTKTPGEFRRSQNWIGQENAALNQATFVPPPPDEMMNALSKWERYLHANTEEHPLIKCGLMHAQFETIHPFLDGNGRLGRLLITFFLCHEGILARPTLYLSLYFKLNRNEYYQKLNAIRHEGDWEGWVSFFLEGIKEVSLESIALISRIQKLLDSHKQVIGKSLKHPSRALRLIDYLAGKPIVTILQVADFLGITHPTASKLLRELVNIRVVELMRRKRPKTFIYKDYLNLIKEGT